jgi:hypothetical protein
LFLSVLSLHFPFLLPLPLFHPTSDGSAHSRCTPRFQLAPRDSTQTTVLPALPVTLTNSFHSPVNIQRVATKQTTAIFPRQPSRCDSSNNSSTLSFTLRLYINLDQNASFRFM